MRANVSKPKYKFLPKFKTDVWNIVKDKIFKHKKWKFLENAEKYKTPKVLDYYQKELAQILVNFRFHFKNQLHIRLHIRYLYGRLQHYKLKQLSIKNKKKSWVNYIRTFEQAPVSLLYRIHLVSSYNEAKTYKKKNYIRVSETANKEYLKKDSILDFDETFKILIRRRLILNYIRFNEYTILNIDLFPEEEEENKISTSKKLKKEVLLKKNIFYIGIHNCIDFEPNSFRFFFLNDIKYFRNHPFKLPFENILRWYTRL